LLPPGTLVSYRVSVELVADFRSGFDASVWDPIWADFHCDWRELSFGQRIEPPSWVIGDQLVAGGVKGILFQSRVVRGGTNLVVYPQALAETDILEVFDPDQALPRDQSSWS
jgi:RES domain-containing protein